MGSTRKDVVEARRRRFKKKQNKERGETTEKRSKEGRIKYEADNRKS